MEGEDYAMSKQEAHANGLTCSSFTEPQLKALQETAPAHDNLESITDVPGNYYACVRPHVGGPYMCVNNKLLNPSFKIGVGADASSLNHNIYQCMRFCSIDGPLIGKTDPLPEPELCLVKSLPPDKSPLFELTWKE